MGGAFGAKGNAPWRCPRARAPEEEGKAPAPEEGKPRAPEEGPSPEEEVWTPILWTEMS